VEAGAGGAAGEALESGVVWGTVCITMEPWGLRICCPGADTICRMLPSNGTAQRTSITTLPGFKCSCKEIHGMN